MKNKTHGVIVVPYNMQPMVRDGLVAFAPTFWLMRYLQGPPEVNGKWAFPGGGLETGETAFEAAIREFREETGLDVDRELFRPFGDRSLHERENGEHYVMDYFTVDLRWQLPRCTEPHKHSPWKLFALHDLPRPIGPSAEIAIGRFLSMRPYE